MTRRKPLSVVEAGRKGGSVRSQEKTAAVRANAAQPRGKRREQWYADGWRDAMERAAEMVLESLHEKMQPEVAAAWTRIADRIAAEPAPKKEGK